MEQGDEGMICESSLNPNFSLSFLWETVGFLSIYMVRERKRVFKVARRERRTLYREEKVDPPWNFSVFYFLPLLTPARGTSDLQPVPM